MILISNVITLPHGPPLLLLHTDDNVAGCGLSRGQLLGSRVLGTNSQVFSSYDSILKTQSWPECWWWGWSPPPQWCCPPSSPPPSASGWSPQPHLQWQLLKRALKIISILSNLWCLYLCSSKGSSPFCQGRISSPRHSFLPLWLIILRNTIFLTL